jgi:hypothetical protein
MISKRKSFTMRPDEHESPGFCSIMIGATNDATKTRDYADRSFSASPARTVSSINIPTRSSTGIYILDRTDGDGEESSTAAKPPLPNINEKALVREREENTPPTPLPLPVRLPIAPVGTKTFSSIKITGPKNILNLLVLISLICMTQGTAICCTQKDPPERPNLTNQRITTLFGGNGHTSSLDGRIVISNIAEYTNTTAKTVTTHWQVRIFRPEQLGYDTQGAPIFDEAFSDGYIIELHNGENALTFCFEDPLLPYRMDNNSMAIYEPYVFDSRMFGPEGYDRSQRIFRRRQMTIRVRHPFTHNAEVDSVDVKPYELLTTVNGDLMKGIEPTMTADGRLLMSCMVILPTMATASISCTAIMIRPVQSVDGVRHTSYRNYIWIPNRPFRSTHCRGIH